jgi:hypothetical protein
LRSSSGARRRSSPGKLEQVEGEQDGFGLVPAPIAQPVEHRDPILAAGDNLAIDQTGPAGKRSYRRRDRGIASRPIEAAAGEKTHAGSITPYHHAEAMVLDLVNRVGEHRH